MKTLIKTLLSVAILFAGFACTTDATDDLATNFAGGGKTTITLSLEESRTQLGKEAGGSFPLYWSDGDKISANGVESNAISVGEGVTAASFTIPTALEAPYCIAYPAAPADQVLFAAEQTHASNTTFASGVSTMYGYSDGSAAVQLQHLTGVLKIGVTGSATLTHAQISNVSRAAIAGPFTIDFTSGKVTPTAESKSIINYSFGEGVTLSNEPTYIHAAVPAGEYSELYVTLYDNAGGVMYAMVKADSTKPLIAGCVRKFTNSIAYNANTSIHIIKDVASLKALATATTDAIVVCDIDLTDEEWAPIEGYAGTLNGNGYAIKGLTAPLFGTTAASIKGLHLRDVKIEEKSNATVGAFARSIENENAVMCDCSATGTISVNCASPVAGPNHSAGLVGKTTSTQTFSGLHNEVNLTIEGEAYTGLYYIAGCIGDMTSASISNSTNLGIITMKGTSNNTMYLSGIAASCNEATNCVNGKKGDKAEVKAGSITYNNANNEQILCMSGISDKHKGNVSYCENHGTISVFGTSTKQCYIGGIIRGANGSNSQIVSYCNNSGKIYIDANIKGITNLAGIAQNTTKNVKILACHNSGDIEIAQTASIENLCHLAGILALATDVTGFTLDGCSNSGNITVCGLTNACRAGGLMGSYMRSGATSTLTLTVNNGFTNSGNITVANTGTAITYCLGGLVGVVKGGVKAATETTAAANYYTKIVTNGDIVNNGKITMKAKSYTETSRIGGLVGALEFNSQIDAKDALINNGEVYYNSDFVGNSKAGLYLGGLIGSIQSTYNFTCWGEAENNGKVSMISSGLTFIGTGGFTGLINAVERNNTIIFKQGFTNNGEIYSYYTGAGGTLRTGGFNGNTAYQAGAQTNIRVIDHLINNAPITVDGQEDKPVGTVVISGLIGQLDKSASKITVESCTVKNTEKGVVTVTENLNTSNIMQAAGIAANFQRQFVPDGSGATITNYGAINVLSKSSKRIVVGGCIGISTVAVANIPYANYGKITCKGTYDKSQANGIGGLVGSLNSGKTTLDNGTCYCEIEATGFECVGFGTGYARTDTHKMTNCKFGGSLVKVERDEEDESETVKRTDLSADNYFEYIYSEAIDKATAEADVCSFLESNPNIQ